MTKARGHRTFLKEQVVFKEVRRAGIILPVLYVFRVYFKLTIVFLKFLFMCAVHVMQCDNHSV